MKCFNAYKKYDTPCQKKNCKYWIEHSNSYNCTILASQQGPMTLQEIGDIFGITRMRVCQIEKKIIEKIKSNLSSLY